MKKTNQSNVSVVLPSYNEKENIEEALERISKAVGKQLLEIIVVDDNSPDGTWKIVQEKSKKNPKYKLIRRMHEKGLASALAEGVSKAKGDIIVWMDCDLGLPPEDIPRLIKELDKYDVAVGSRYVKGGKDTRNFFRAYLSLMLNLFAGLLLGNYIKDYTSGFIAVKKQVLTEIKLSTKGFGEYFTEFIYCAGKKGFKITEVGYIYTNRKKGKSKSDGDIFTLFKLGIQYGLTIIKLFLKNINKNTNNNI
ncbi:MAG: polyprenol monophosphomannose synthase [Candidatus Diapherotrites archaeon]|nr:polyprenol monophosphomannose synthase [Candidatus Diapherotrites archaeon]